MQSRRQIKTAPGEDWFSWLLPTVAVPDPNRLPHLRLGSVQVPTLAPFTFCRTHRQHRLQTPSESHPRTLGVFVFHPFFIAEAQYRKPCGGVGTLAHRTLR